MAIDYQLFIDELRLLLKSSVSATEDQIRSKAEQYAELCEQANLRLKKCYFFMRKQNYAEMERLVRIKPNLLDLTRSLLIPELDDLRSLVQQLGFKEPEELIVDYSIDIQEACEKFEEKRALYERLRFYSLIGAPIIYRIGIMYQISALEPENEQLKRDIETFETFYFSVLEKEGSKILQRGNLDEMEQAMQILNRPKWIQTPLAKTFCAAIIKIRKEADYQELVSIGRNLQDAMNRSDENDVEEYLSQWDARMAKEFNQNPPADEARFAMDARKWLDSRWAVRKNAIAYRSSTDELIQEIENCANKKEIQAVYDEYKRRVQSFGETIPEEIEQFVQDKYKNFTTRFLIKILVCVSVGLVSALLIATLVTKYL